MLFFPLDKHLFVGQTIIFAVAGLLSSYRFYTSKKYFKSGSLFALTLFKPHLFIPLYVLLTIKAFREKRTNVVQFLTGTFLVVFVLSGIAIQQFAYYSWLFMTDAFLLEWGTILLPPTLWVVLLLLWYQHPLNNTKKIPAEIL